MGVDSAIFTGATLEGIVLPVGYSVSGGYVVGGERPVPWSFVQSLVTPLEGQIAELSQRPTQASYDAVVAERDARFTEDQIRALSADYTIGLNEAGNVQMKINFFESADLNTFTPFTVTPESVSVVDGSICFEFAPTGNEIGRAHV